MFFVRKKTAVQIPESILGVTVRQSARARRMALRMDVRLGDIVLVWPKRTSAARAESFIAENRKWIEEQRQRLRPAQVFTDGSVITVHGKEVTIAAKTGRGITRIENDLLIVHGQPAHHARRVKDFLKVQAASILKQASDQKAQLLDLKPAPVRVIDPKSRWGSCAHDGKLMYSWRLILAPPAVLDYVVAHEVAHRVHMNHGRGFWKLCASLTENAAASRRWLRTHGQELMLWR